MIVLDTQSCVTEEMVVDMTVSIILAALSPGDRLRVKESFYLRSPDEWRSFIFRLVQE